LTIVTPMMRQYQAIKEQYSDCLLFFRLGDFYEMFADDALIASRELEIVLTARDGGNGSKIPMCGVPFHAVDNYVARLINNGYKVAICEQVEDPKTAKSIVKRDVIRVITPGTVVENHLLEEKRYNYLAAVWRLKKDSRLHFGLAYTDISTGLFMVTEIENGESWDDLANELLRISPAELVLPQDLYNEEFFQLRLKENGVHLSHAYDDSFLRNNINEILQIHFAVSSMEALGLQSYPAATAAAATIIDFLQHTQKRSLKYIDNIQLYNTSQYMIIGAATRRNLELTETIRGNKRKGSLLWVCDNTLTAMGGRKLRDWIEKPLLNSELINRRLNAVSELIDRNNLLEELRCQLKEIYDLPRLMGRISYGNISPRDLLSLNKSLQSLPTIFAILGRLKCELFSIYFDHFDLLEDIKKIIDSAVCDDAPLSQRDGNIIRSGYNQEVDQLRSICSGGKQLLLQLEAEERERTGIRNLRIGYNKVFGYYIDVSKGQLANVPERYFRKQTLVNGERFITEELKAAENDILGADERLKSLEYDLFCEMRNTIAEQAHRILDNAEVISQLDSLQSLATAAIDNNYCRPIVNDERLISITAGRHPVIEKMIGQERYIPNDTLFDDHQQQMMIITGPNMAGKSTYMRQVALIALMARIGSFVPAKEAIIGKVDRIFTRVGASDDLTAGQSTFMVEMCETSNILRHATADSLIILDEIGRGTSTFDGLSIAWAVAEYLMRNESKPRTLFATHYHELTALADSYLLIKNYSIMVKEHDGKIVFLRKIVAGATDRSYGIQVASLAGLPPQLLMRANEILHALEQDKQSAAIPEAGHYTADIVDKHPLIDELKTIDCENLTPIAALNKIHQWQKAILAEDE